MSSEPVISLASCFTLVYCFKSKVRPLDCFLFIVLQRDAWRVHLVKMHLVDSQSKGNL